nr:MAG TPA: Spc24 subunit of Ndc80 [Caudoviricetes sp.]
MRDTNLVNALREHADWWENGDMMDPLGGLEKDLFAAADRLENQNAHIAALQKEIEKLRAQLRHLGELAEADKEGRLFLLPLEPGRPMLCQEHFERPLVMKNVAPCVQYQSSVGVVFHMGYDVFRGLVERGKITPLSPEGEKALEAMKDE